MAYSPSKAGGGGCSDVLWVNPDNTQGVAENTIIPVDLSGYDQAFIIQKGSRGQNFYDGKGISIGGSATIYQQYAGLGTVQRDYSVSATGVTAGWCHGDGSYYAVPCMIIGIKNT